MEIEQIWLSTSTMYMQRVSMLKTKDTCNRPALMQAILFFFGRLETFRTNEFRDITNAQLNIQNNVFLLNINNIILVFLL